jgi:hypothetical protein
MIGVCRTFRGRFGQTAHGSRVRRRRKASQYVALTTRAYPCLGSGLADTAVHRRARFSCKSSRRPASMLPAFDRRCSTWCTRPVPARCCLFSKHTTGRAWDCHDHARPFCTAFCPSRQWGQRAVSSSRSPSVRPPLSKSPVSYASTTAWTRSRRFSFWGICVMCVLTVVSTPAKPPGASASSRDVPVP